MITFGYNGVFLGTIGVEYLEQMAGWRNDPLIRNWCRQTGLISMTDQEVWYEKINSDPTATMYTIECEKGVVGICGFTNSCCTQFR